jgi:hypothetical protein
MTSLSRRDFLRLSAVGAGTASLSGWLGVLAGRAAEAGLKHKACILLWMDGGPSHLDTFDLKPEAPEGVRGEFKPIDTNVPGIQVSEHFPLFSRFANRAALLRGMSTAEGAHGRARYFMHTGYKEGSGGVVHPSLGALVSSELGRSEFPLPNFVAVGGRSYGAGFLGPRHQPLIVQNPALGVENLRPLVNDTAFERRVGLLEEMEQAFFREYKAGAAHAHRTTYKRAVQLMQSKEARAFDLSAEPEKVRAAYGDTRFGNGCLLARRLVEVGVPFVEVVLPGWDTHQNNFERTKNLSAQVDPAMAALLRDLLERGLLDSTLVIWMGEFGRTPRINSRGAQPGRDHYPRAWTSVLVGGGIRGGQVVGKTDPNGAGVSDRPIPALDFLATVCRALGIDHTKQNPTPIGRPIRIVDKGAKPLPEVVG